MSTEVIEASGQQEIYTLRCRACGDTKCRTVMRYTLSGSQGHVITPAVQVPCPPRLAVPGAPPPMAGGPAGA
jgi:hypothetical protein